MAPCLASNKAGMAYGKSILSYLSGKSANHHQTRNKKFTSSSEIFVISLFLAEYLAMKEVVAATSAEFNGNCVFTESPVNALLLEHNGILSDGSSGLNQTADRRSITPYVIETQYFPSLVFEP
jgi:hypothetical protein